MVILVLNVGLKNSRCIAFSQNGTILAEANEQIKTYINYDKVEQEPEDWCCLSWSSIKQVISLLGNRSQDIKYLTVTTSASCLVIVDSSSSIRRSILVSDTRSEDQAKVARQ